MNDKFLQECLKQATISLHKGGFPAGAVVVKEGQIISRGQSLGALINDPTSHGEIAAIREACKTLGTNSLTDCTLYSSLEPCQMCKSAAYWAGVRNIIFIVEKKAVNNDYYEKNVLNIKQVDTLRTKVLELLQ